MTPFERATAAARLPVVNFDRAREWHRNKLGLEPVEEREGGLRYVLGGSEFCLFISTGASDGAFTQLAISVPDIEATAASLRARGVKFEEYDFPGMTTIDGIATIEGNYASKGRAERGAWFRDCEGNMIAIGESIP